MNESKLVRYTPEVVHKTVATGASYGVAEMREREHGTYVTHADYKALEDECERLRAQAASDRELLAFGFIPLLEWALGSIDELNDGPMTADQWGEDAGLYQQTRGLIDKARQESRHG